MIQLIHDLSQVLCSALSSLLERVATRVRKPFARRSLGGFFLRYIPHRIPQLVRFEIPDVPDVVFGQHDFSRHAGALRAVCAVT